MATIKVYDQEKQEVGSVELAPEVFEVEARPEILNLVVRAQRAAQRAGTHKAKTRAFVSGGGVKPWKQKGTGRARAGSNRSPIWRGGAIIFGPLPRDYSFKVNSKVRSLGHAHGSFQPCGRQQPSGREGHQSFPMGRPRILPRLPRPWASLRLSWLLLK